VVRIGARGELREIDLADEVASALWVHSDAAHSGCSVARQEERRNA
jgi:DtxR family Mn-dependent transcriptional regulator